MCDGCEQGHLFFHALREGVLNLSHSGVDVAHSAIDIVDLCKKGLYR